MAAAQEKVVTDAEAAWVIRIGVVALAAGGLLLPIAVGFWVAGDAATAMRLIAASSLGLILGYPVAGAVPPYLAGRASVFSFGQIVRSPFRWFRGARGVRAFARVREVRGVTWQEFATAVQFGADAETLAEAIEARHAKGYRVDMKALFAAQLAGMDLVEAARARDALGFVKQHVAARKAEAERRASGA
jgi:hypothetical protein